MNDALVSLLNGAGIGDILIPKKDFIKEHKHIVGLLRKYDIPELNAEANKQAKELKAETGIDMTGGSMGFAREHQARIARYNALSPEKKAIVDANIAKRKAIIKERNENAIRFTTPEEYEEYKAEKERRKREYEESQKKGFFENLGDGLLGIARSIFGGSNGSTHRESVLKKYKLKDKPYSIAELAKITSVPESILQEVYNRGVGAYKTQGKSVRLKHSFVKNVDAPMSKKLSKEQWGYARVYSFLNGNPAHDEDLRKNAGGFSKQSGFIRRLMAENALKHQGQYRKPTFPLHPDSTMNEPAEFEYKKLANANQRGFNESEYGASPFITKHFGSVRAVPFERKRGVPPPLEPYGKKKKTKEVKTQETEQQKEARREFEEESKEARREFEEESKEQEPTRQITPLPQGSRPITKDNYDGYIDKYIESESDKLHFYQPESGWLSTGGIPKWVGYYISGEIGKEKFIKNTDYIIEPGINLKTIITETDRKYGMYEPTHKYFVPVSECVLKKGDETIEVQKVEIPALNKYEGKYWCLYSPKFGRHTADYSNRHRPIRAEVITKKGSFTFTLETQLEAENQISIGRSASLILYGPKKTYQQSDSRISYPTNREEKLSKGKIKYETEVLRWLENRKFDDMVLTINGKRYRMFEKEKDFPLYSWKKYTDDDE